MRFLLYGITAAWDESQAFLSSKTHDCRESQSITTSRYAAYKDSGVEWIGEIPEGWKVQKIKFVAQINPIGNRSLKDERVTFLPMEAVSSIGDYDISRVGLRSDFPSSLTEFQKSDVILAKITPCFENGKGAYLDKLTTPKGIGSTEFHVLRSYKNINPKYLYYSLANSGYRNFAEPFMEGTAGQKRLTTPFLKNSYVSFPNLHTQKKIVQFIDQKTVAIDTAIAKKQRLIELLKEQKAILINRAVTRGLNPDAPMKDSGVEWIGEIPAHWEVKKLKYLTNGIIDSEHKTAPFFDNGKFLIVRTTNVKNGEIVLDKAQFTDHKIYQEWTKRATPRAGDVLLTREAPAGEACVLEKDNFALLGQRMVLLRINKALINPYFLVSSIYQGAAKRFINILSVGSTVAHFNMSDIKNIPVLVPNLKEQLQISAYITNITKKINNSVGLELSLIQKLNEYKQTLIAHAVTGKIKVS